jgi:hypothetical protein
VRGGTMQRNRRECAVPPRLGTIDGIEVIDRNRWLMRKVVRWIN